MLTVFLYILYLSLAFWGFKVFQLNKGTGFGVHLIFAVFIIKFLAGCLNLYVHYHYYLTNDIYFYYEQSIAELKQARSAPMAFLYSWLFDWEDMHHHLNIFEKQNMVYWSSLGTLVHTKLMTLFNILTLGNKYMNVLFYNVLFFIGQLALYKTFYKYNPHQKYVLLILIFLLPSVLFWTSGIHKDGLVLSLIGILSYYTDAWLDTRKKRCVLWMMLSLFGLLTIRYFYALCIFPALFCWIVSDRMRYKGLIFAVAYTVGFILFFNLHRWTNVNPMALVQNRQTEFMSLRGYSDMSTPVLDNTAGSYLRNLPSSLNHIFLRPYIQRSDPWKYQITAWDTYLILTLILVFLIFLKRNRMNQSLYWFTIFFSLSMLLFIGYAIPNCGALVRYRANFMAILLPTLFVISEIPGMNRINKWLDRTCSFLT